MEQVHLGTTGTRVSRLGLGTAGFGTTLDEAAATELVGHALDAGITWFDTADAYADGRSEEILGRALAERRDEVVLSTKAFGRTGDGPNDAGSSRSHLLGAVEASLRRLRTDRIDLYQLHQPDPATPIEESLRTLEDLVRAGKVVHVGCSNFYPLQLCEALWAAKRLGATPFATEQIPYSPLDRRVEAELLPYAIRHGVGLIPYSVLAQGLLGGRYAGSAAPPGDSRCDREELWREWYRRIPPASFEHVTWLAELARERDTTLAALSAAWVLRREPIRTAIAGPRTPAQLDELAAGLDLELDETLLARIDERLPPGSFAAVPA